MKELAKSKKMILSLLGIAAVVGLVLAGQDLETVKWVGGFIAGMVASLNLGQGLADGLSEGRTSALGQHRQP
ncbi:MAG TPA: hypothetical protein VM219_06440 [Phycisphaerae bacterium]|nr:hypothetical protein [Phycisphaerae bacterium]